MEEFAPDEHMDERFGIEAWGIFKDALDALGTKPMGGSGIVEGSQHGRDCGTAEHVRGTQTIKCAGYNNKKMSVDYSPRDPRPWLTACRDRNCPADRCLDMPNE